jgi:hypothetical protein
MICNSIISGQAFENVTKSKPGNVFQLNKKLNKMKRSIIIILFLCGMTGFSQETEFGKSNNGLIYSDTTIKQLKFIVDSLNLKFKVCDLNKIYYSKLQAKANHVSLEGATVKDAKKDMDDNIPFDDFEKKYGKAEIEKDLLVVKFKYKDYEEKDVVEFSSIELNDKYGHESRFGENLSKYDKQLKGKWIYEYYGKTEYSKESIYAFYFTEEFSNKPLPEVYAKMVQYSDCMVDTNTQVFFEKAQKGGVRYGNQEHGKVKEFMNYVHESTGYPDYSNGSDTNYWKKLEAWDSLCVLRVDSLKKNDGKFNTLLNEAVKEAIKDGGTNDEFEDYVGRYYSRKTELDLKRNRIVVGGCSMDNSPRVHALNIAKLAAETVNWEIFLRSHLDIMNDRFERASDGSYAWGRRQTYIKELEVLDIDVLDLLLGISLRVENPSMNHYYGSIGRLGRALSETNKSGEIEAKMLQMISDNNLDDYNRILIYYLFLNYNYYIEDKEKQKENQAKLIAAVQTLPAYLSTKIMEKK